MRRALALAAAAVLALAVPAAATAQECPRTSLAAIESDVMCPVCGTSLALASEAPQANRQRALIQRLVDRCRSKEQIESVLVAQFGEDVLALPEPTGFQLSAYLVPLLAVLAAAGGIALAARRWRFAGGRDGPPDAGGPDSDATPGARPDAATAKRLDADLERYDL